MVNRRYWQNRIEKLWTERSVLWLTGARRTGKTFLTKSLPDIEYFDCELPRVRAMMDDPEGFLAGLRGKRVVLDEVHRLANPSELLKIAADHFPDVRVLATGSSSLGATTKFQDTLTGRKLTVHLTPMISSDSTDFGDRGLSHRLLFGGLPPFYVAEAFPESQFQEWMDSFWAKDIQELFRLELRHSFQKFMELLMVQSGGIFDASRFASQSEASRGTISNYLKVMEATHIVRIVRPYFSKKSSEIISAPKVFFFDTGFIAFAKGWVGLRPEDFGVMWEHFVLNELTAAVSGAEIMYWRDKRGHEVDFVISRRSGKYFAIECKWKAGDFESRNMALFFNTYSRGEYFVVAGDVTRPYKKSFGEMVVTFTGLEGLVAVLQAS
jgi:hypothetical protein